MEDGYRDGFLRKWFLSWVLKAEFRAHGGGGRDTPGGGTYRPQSRFPKREGAPPKFSPLTCVLSPPGGRDRAGRPLLLVSTTQGAWEAPWCTASEVTKLLSYLCSVPR